MGKASHIIINLLLYNLLANSFLLNAQVLPNSAPAFYKRNTYLSDNLKQNSLDLFIDSILKPYIQSSEHCGISIGILNKGREYFYNYGETKRNSGNLPQETTLYEIGAFTTTFCGMLLAQAIKENKIKAESDIRDYLPDKFPALQFNRSPVLIKHLANHSSGLPMLPENLKEQNGYDPLNPYANYTQQMLLSYIKNITLTNKPGTSSDYSNINIAILGMILEQVYGRPFEELVAEKICRPLQMNNTGIRLTIEQNEKRAQGYNQDGEQTPEWTFDVFKPAGALKSTCRDLLYYLKFQLEEKDTALNLSRTKPPTVEKTHFKMAWNVSKTKSGNTLYSQSGGTFGYGTFGAFIPEKQCSVIILSNNGVNLEFLGIRILNFLQG